LERAAVPPQPVQTGYTVCGLITSAVGGKKELTRGNVLRAPAVLEQLERLMSLAKNRHLTAEEYLKGESAADVKHEFLSGEIWAMVGASDAHVTIALNLAAALKEKLKGSPCRTYISDMKVRVEQADAFFYPDVFVACDERDKKNDLYKEHPLFIAEVLSPSTEAFDRGRKFGIYRRLESLVDYWLIDAEKRYIDSFVRLDNGDWVLRSYSERDASAVIQSLDIKLPVAVIYDDVIG
jgi:Uma2 family endonuclease